MNTPKVQLPNDITGKSASKTKRTDKLKSGEAKRDISQKATLELWVRSGGRCAICNTFLLEHPRKRTPLNIAQRAHNVGWTDTDGSPRGKHGLALDQRNEASNLLLLCHPCHKEIDNPDKLGEYTVERLTEIKNEHEDRIHHLTEMAKDQETAVLRVFGAIRTIKPELARDEAVQCVLHSGNRYARFPLAPGGNRSVELNMNDLGDPETVPQYWDIGKSQIDRICNRVSEAINMNEIRHVSVFALARIPLLVYLGYKLGDKVETELYQRHRNEGWKWPNDEAVPQFEYVRHQEQDACESPTDAVLILSLSGSIKVNELPREVIGLTTYEIRPVGITPNPYIFRSQGSVKAFARTYQNLLAEIEKSAKSIKTIHLFLAVPTTAAIVCGSHILRDAQPALVIYDLMNGLYTQTITINKK